MFLFAHTGIALGAVWLFQESADACSVNGAASKSTAAVPKAFCRTMAWVSGLHIDYRLLALGSMLPDLIDKPVGHWIMGSLFSNGRIFAHTGVFFLVVAIAGLWRTICPGKLGWLSIAVGVLFHLLLDSMWSTPRVLLWPLYGWAFEQIDLSNWFSESLAELVSKPGTYVPEVIGASMLALFLARLKQRGQFLRFLKAGVRP